MWPATQTHENKNGNANLIKSCRWIVLGHMGSSTIKIESGVIVYPGSKLSSSRQLWRAASRVIELRNVFIPLGLVVVLLVYFAQNLLVFDMINTYLMFFLCLGFTYFLTQKQETEEETKPISVNLVIGAIIIVAMIFVFWVGNVQPLMANRNIINVVQSSRQSRNRKTSVGNTFSRLTHMRHGRRADKAN